MTGRDGRHRGTLMAAGDGRPAPPLFLYDGLPGWGGAERVLYTLYEAFSGHACVGFWDRDHFPESFDPARLIEFGAQRAHPAMQLARILHAFRTRAPEIVARYETRVYTGAYTPLAHRADHPGRSIYYCHTPPRFLYDLKAYYHETFPAWQRPLLAGLRRWFQPRYEVAVRGMDVVLANSENVRRRLVRDVGVDAQVIYPPVDVAGYRWLGDEGYFLSTGRLEPLKRVDRLIEAFLAMPDQRLVVTSGGSELPRLKALAAGAPNIHFTGWLNPADLARWMGEARATLYIPVDEDFGMSPVESMAAGKPVIGVAEGGLLETVVDGETGVLLDPTCEVDAIREAVRGMTSARASEMRGAAEARAQHFSEPRFLEAMQAVLGGAAGGGRG